MTIIYQILIIISAYLLGSIPFGLILARKSTGHDIRSFGSGNIGSTNVKRVAGKKIAIQTQLLDMLKGLLPVGATMLLYYYNFIQAPSYFIYLVAIASILGHDFSVFLRFKGGKGVNTTLGASILISPVSVLAGVVAYYLTKWLFKYVSLGSIVLGFVIVVADYIIAGSVDQLIYFSSCYLLILLQHLENIRRLISGTETRVDR